MKKFIIFILTIILILEVGYYFKYKKPISEILININNEQESFENYFDSVKDSFSMITVTSLTNGEILTNENYFGREEYKQIFIMEELLKTNKDKFIVLSSDGETLANDIEPTSDGVLAYYPEKDYIEEYEKYFSIYNDNKIKNNSEYDNEYVYYPNKRSGLNGMRVDEFKINNLEYKNNIYTVSLTLNYSDRVKDMINRSKDEAIISYIKNEGNIILKEYIIKK